MSFRQKARIDGKAEFYRTKTDVFLMYHYVSQVSQGLTCYGE